jgi:hypothetical protein
MSRKELEARARSGIRLTYEHSDIGWTVHAEGPRSDFSPYMDRNHIQVDIRTDPYGDLDFACTDALALLEAAGMLQETVPA